MQSLKSGLRTSWSSLLFSGIVSTSILAIAQAHSVDVAYSLSPPRVSLGEPVVLTLSIRNNLRRPISVNLGIEQTQNFEFILVQPDGRTIRARPPLRGGFSPPGTVQLRPDETYFKEFFLSGWVDFGKAGQYDIAVLFHGTVSDFEGGNVPVDLDGHLALELDDRNENQLREVCSDLLSKISSAKSYEQAESAAKALSTVRDPVALSYLKDAAAFWHLEPIVIPGLAKIGGLRAAMALMSIFQNGSQDGRQLARSALQRLQEQTSDQDLKQVIERELQSSKGEDRDQR